jgi:hypothetical protein
MRRRNGHPVISNSSICAATTPRRLLDFRRGFVSPGLPPGSRPAWWCSSAGASRSRSALSTRSKSMGVMPLSFAPPQPARRRMAVSPLALPPSRGPSYRPEKDPFWDNIQSGGRSSKSGFARVTRIVLEVGLTRTGVLRLGCGSHQCLTAKRSHSSIFWKNRPFDPTLGPSSGTRAVNVPPP